MIQGTNCRMWLLVSHPKPKSSLSALPWDRSSNYLFHHHYLKLVVQGRQELRSWEPWTSHCRAPDRAGWAGRAQYLDKCSTKLHTDRVAKEIRKILSSAHSPDKLNRITYYTLCLYTSGDLGSEQRWLDPCRDPEQRSQELLWGQPGDLHQSRWLPRLDLRHHVQDWPRGAIRTWIFLQNQPPSKPKTKKDELGPSLKLLSLEAPKVTKYNVYNLRLTCHCCLRSRWSNQVNVHVKNTGPWDSQLSQGICGDLVTRLKSCRW